MLVEPLSPLGSRIEVVQIPRHPRARLLRWTDADEFFDDRWDGVLWSAGVAMAVLGGLWVLIASAGPAIRPDVGAAFVFIGLLFCLSGAVRRRLFPLLLSERGLRRRLSQLPMHVQTEDLPDGETVRLRGVVEAGVAFRSRITDSRVVLARYLRGARPLDTNADEGVCTEDGYQEMVGVDFSIRLPDGTSVSVEVAQAYLLLRDRRPNCRATDLSPEMAVCPGDEVDVVGRLTRRVDVYGRPSSHRGVPMLPCMDGDDRHPLIVRRTRTSVERMLS